MNLNNSSDSEGGVTREESLLHDLESQGIVPQFDTLSVLTHVCMGCTSIHISSRRNKGQYQKDNGFRFT